MKRIALLFAGVVLFAAPLPAQSAFDLFEIAWTMSPEPSGESAAMEMRLEPLHDRERIVVRIPWWRPGSYRYFKYEERISNLRAVDGEGREREIVSLDSRTWEIDVAGARELTIRYDLELENLAAEGETPAIHLHGPATFLYLEGEKDLSHTLRFELPEGWKAASGHRRDSRDADVFRAPDYDVFVDCPLALGELEVHEFEAWDRRFEVVFFGRVPEAEVFDREDWLRRVRAIVETAHEIMGPPPFEKYVFLFHFYDRGGVYGLEHLNSTSIGAHYRIAQGRGGLATLESVTAHEYFHLWNVKRIRPVQLGPFDYSQDVRTKDLWWMEGLTSYYADVILQRAGLRDNAGADWFWDAQAQVFRGMSRAPGYGKSSPERSSWSVWEPNPSTRISYYDQGQVLGLLLDVKIRTETDNRRSLDDVFRFLTRWVDYPEAGYRPGDLERAIYAVTGWDCSQFFDRYVSGLLPPPYQEILGPAGLQVLQAEPGDPYLGFGTSDRMELEVREGSAVYAEGLRSGDRLTHLGATRVASATELREAIDGLLVGESVEVRVLRGDAEVSVTIEVGERTRPLFLIRPDPEATPGQVRVREGVLTGVPKSV